MSVRYCGNEKRSQSVGKAKRNITFQNTFASTETQQHVKPLRMIDEVCFEMVTIKQTRLKMEETPRERLESKAELLNAIRNWLWQERITAEELQAEIEYIQRNPLPF